MHEINCIHFPLVCQVWFLKNPSNKTKYEQVTTGYLTCSSGRCPFPSQQWQWGHLCQILYENVCRVTILFFVCKALKNKIGIIIAYLLRALFPKIYKDDWVRKLWVGHCWPLFQRWLTGTGLRTNNRRLGSQFWPFCASSKFSSSKAHVK